MSLARHHKRKWNEQGNTSLDSPPLTIPSKKAPFELTRSALESRLITLQKEEKEIIVKFTEAILTERDYSEFSQQMKIKQNEIMYIKHKLK